MAEQVLSSLWDGLSPHLIASFYVVDRTGKRIDEITVRSPLSEASIDSQQSWQSSFENVGQSSLPTLQQMLQSGALNPLSKLIDKTGLTNLSGAVATVEGRSSITKLNSVQVWQGSPPLKLQVTAIFRSWKDAITEVENPADLLFKWSLPIHLESDNTILTRLYDNGADPSTVFPSQIPVLIAMRYKNRVYAPLVIESISFPLGGPIDKGGHYTELAVAMTLCSIASIDQDDWANYNEGQGNSTIKPKR